MMQNPATNNEVSAEAEKAISDLRAVRRNSRRAMRSGNPAKRAEAARVNAQAPLLIRAIYANEMRAGR